MYCCISLMTFFNCIRTHFFTNTGPSICSIHIYYATDYKLALWATLVFFVYGSSLQSSAGLLLCAARLVLHSHLEPYRDPVDNLFDCKLAFQPTQIKSGPSIYMHVENHPCHLFSVTSLIEYA